jgi:F-type H+-transporting ATPase subunit epsilon
MAATSDKIKLEIATPERMLLTEEIDEVVMPGSEGYLGIRPGHAPLLTGLDVGEISLRSGSEERYLSCSGGFAEVSEDRVTILADTAELSEEIDVERAKKAQADAETRMKGDPDPDEFRRMELRLKRAISRIQVSERRG